MARKGLLWTVAALMASVALVAVQAQAPAGAPAQAPAPAQPVQPPSTAQPVQGPSFRAGVDVVSLNVTVTEVGPGQRYVTDLEPTDFEVYEDGVKQDVTLFNKTNTPIALALLLDTSASMETKIQTAQEAAIGFARRLRPQDLAEIIEFNSRASIPQAFTNDVPKLERAIHMTSASGATSMYQALYIAMSEFKKLRRTTPNAPDEIRREAVVLVSDGQDTTSMFSFDDILDIVKRSETAVYSIGLKSATEPQNRSFNNGDFSLRQFATQTGGRAFFPEKVEDLHGVYAQIADELSSQYTIGYTSKNHRRDGAWRKIIVRVSRPNVTPRTKQGYFAATR
jgi:Ca-activated chloride channel family protein